MGAMHSDWSTSGNIYVMKTYATRPAFSDDRALVAALRIRHITCSTPNSKKNLNQGATSTNRGIKGIAVNRFNKILLFKFKYMKK